MYFRNLEIEYTDSSFKLSMLSETMLINNISMYRFLSKHLSIWDMDHKTKRFYIKQKFYAYYNNYLYIPIYLKHVLENFLKENKINYKFIYKKACEGKDIDINIKKGFTYKDTRQEKAVEFLNKNTSNIKCLELRTGSGKTVTTIKHLTYFKKRAFIATTELIDQWYGELLKWTDLKEKDIYIIKGKDSIQYLVDNIDKTIFPKIIIYSIRTFTNYLSNQNDLYNDLPSLDDLIFKLNIGIRVVDESHLSFHASYLHSLIFNVKSNIGLSATFMMSHNKIQMIFDHFYHLKNRFLGDADGEKYTKIYFHGYDLHFYINKFHYSLANMYNHVKYENYILKKEFLIKTYIDYNLNKMVNKYYINKNKTGKYKCLIFASTIAMCEMMKTRLSKLYPNLKVDIFVGGSKESVYKKNDIIISTPGSSSTGKDIENLMTVIQTISIGSKSRNIQSLGRLRKLENKTTRFVLLYNKNIDTHVNNKKALNTLYFKYAKDGIEET